MRIVSLVPSITETLYALGLPPGALVARTEWCDRPAAELQHVATVGGTKNPHIAEIIRLAPDLVLMDAEENRRPDWEALTAAGLRVRASEVRSVADAAAMVEELGALCDLHEGAQRMHAEIEAALSEATQSRLEAGGPREHAGETPALHAGGPREHAGETPALHAGGPSLHAGETPALHANAPRIIPLIWHKPLMSVAATRYTGDLLQCAGFEICPPPANDAPYPQWTLDSLAVARPDVLLLSQEPHDFSAEEAAALHEAMDARGLAELRVVKWEAGYELTWFGAATPAALRAFTRFCASCRGV